MFATTLNTAAHNRYNVDHTIQNDGGKKGEGEGWEEGPQHVGGEELQDEVAAAREGRCGGLGFEVSSNSTHIKHDF